MSAPLLTLGDLEARFARRPESLLELADDIATRFVALGDAHVPALLGAAARDLLARCPDPSALPLWGVPYVVGANIDVAGLLTSAGLPALDFLPDFDAVVVERLRAAGALLVGKVPADPLGLDASALGSAEAVAIGLAAFGIATDRSGIAGCGVAEVRPTPGWVSVDGLFSVASELDGIVIHAVDVGDSAAVRRIAGSPKPGTGASSRFARLGLFGTDRSSVSQAIVERLGLTTVIIDEALFAEVAALVDDDVWLPLRLDDVALAFIEQPNLFPPRSRRRLSSALDCPARLLVQAQRHLSTLRRQVDVAFSDIDLLFVPPTFGSASFTNACGLTAVVLPTGGALVGAGGDDDRLAAAAATLIAPNQSRSTRPIDILASSPLAHR